MLLLFDLHDVMLSTSCSAMSAASAMEDQVLEDFLSCMV